MNTNKHLILDNRGNLSTTLLNFLKENCSKEFIPTIDEQGYRFDWKIIGIEFKKYFGFNNPTKPQDLDFVTWKKAIPEVRNLVNWISLNIFYPTKIIGRSQQTDRVLIRISVSMLNKIDLPRYYKDTIFDNIIYCYYNRKRAYNEFFYRVIMDPPF